MTEQEFIEGHQAAEPDLIDDDNEPDEAAAPGQEDSSDA